MLEMRQELTLLKAQASLQSPGPSPAAVSPASLSPSPTGDTDTPPPPMYSTHGTFHTHSPLDQTYLDATHSSGSYRPGMLLTPPDDSSPHHAPFIRGQCMLGSGSTSGPPLVLSSPSPSAALVTPEPSPRLLFSRPGPSTSGVGPHADFVVGSSSQSYVTAGHSPTISNANIEGESDVVYAPPRVSVSTASSDARERSFSPAAIVLGKRRNPPVSSGHSSASSEDENGPESTGNMLRKRLNGHDRRCLTIHVSKSLSFGVKSLWGLSHSMQCAHIFCDACTYTTISTYLTAM